MSKQVLQVSVRTEEEIQYGDSLVSDIEELIVQAKADGVPMTLEESLEICSFARELAAKCTRLHKELRRLITANVVIENEALKGE